MRENARRASCQSNEKQLGLAFIQYTQDNDEYLLAAAAGTHYSVNPAGWAGQLYPFVKSTGIYVCPDDPHGPNAVSYVMNLNLMNFNIAKAAAPASTLLLYEEFRVSNDTTIATGNPAIGSVADGTPDGQPPRSDFEGGDGAVATSYLTPEMELGSSSFAGDGRHWSSTTPGRLGPGDMGGCGSGGSSPTMHDPGSNYLALDGHVKFLRPEQISTGAAWTGSATTPGSCSSDAPAGSSAMTQNGSPVVLTFQYK